jgi:uncharacterized protein YndB with AHSA1/START domain
MDNDKIERKIELKASVSKVWNALVDYQQFGEWFRVKLEGPFIVGQVARGHITYPGYEHYKWEATVVKIEPEKIFSFSWRPYAIDLNKDYSKELPTLVEFRLDPTGTGTLLTLTESGFNNVPAERREEAFRMNSNGWTTQMKNIETHVTSK